MEKAIPEGKSPFATEPIGRLILKFAVPSVIALLVNSLYNIVDQIFIGWGVGYLGNGATNIVFPTGGNLSDFHQSHSEPVWRHRFAPSLCPELWPHHRCGPALYDDFRCHQLHNPG